MWRCRIEAVQRRGAQDQRRVGLWCAEWRFRGEIEIAQLVWGAILAETEAGRRGAANEVGIEKASATGACHPPGVLARLEKVAHVAIALVAEQRTPDRRRVEIGHVEVDEGLVRPGQRLRIEAGAGAVGKSRFQLCVADRESADRAAGEELAEVCGRVYIVAHRCWWAPAGRSGETEAGPCHGECRGENRLVENAHRRGGLGDAVEHHTALAGMFVALAIDGGYGDVLTQVAPGVLGHEGTQGRFAETAQENRLVLPQDFDVHETAVPIE